MNPKHDVPGGHHAQAGGWISRPLPEAGGGGSGSGGGFGGGGGGGAGTSGSKHSLGSVGLGSSSGGGGPSRVRTLPVGVDPGDPDCTGSGGGGGGGGGVLEDNPLIRAAERCPLMLRFGGKVRILFVFKLASKISVCTRHDITISEQASMS
jgi:hypothetical protein